MTDEVSSSLSSGGGPRLKASHRHNPTFFLFTRFLLFVFFVLSRNFD